MSSRRRASSLVRLTPRLVLVGILLSLVPLATVYVLSRLDMPAQIANDTRHVLDDQSRLLAAWAAPRLAEETERVEALANARAAAKAAGLPPPAASFPLQAEVQALARDGDGLRYTIILADGVVVADSGRDPHGLGNHADRAEVEEARRNGVGWSMRPSDSLDRAMVYAARRVDGESGNVLGTVRVALLAERVEDRGARLMSWLGRAWWIALALGVPLVVGLARQLVRRIRRVRDTGLAVVAGEHDRRVEGAGSDEIGDLGRVVNAMAAHFADQVGTIGSERRSLQAILGAMVEGVIGIDAEGRVIHGNASAGRILGFDVSRALGQPVWEVVRVGRISQVLRESLAAGRPVEQAVTVVRDGQVRSLRLHTAPLPAGDTARGGTRPVARGGAQSAVVVVQDITELRRLETVRRDFVANASHELKTPVAAIRGLVETILDDPEMHEDVRTGFLDRIRTQAGRLQGLVEEMLALSRFEADQGADPQRDIDIRGPVRDAFDGIAALAAEKAIAFTWDVAPDPLVVRAHPEAIRRIASNLLDNAVKYTPPHGKVHLTMRGEGPSVLLVIEDDGPGIAPEQRGRVFERFYRVDPGRAREAGGTGLGLAIVKHLVQSMGGDVALVERPGPGAVFEVRLPAAV